MASGQGIFHLYVTCPREILVSFVFKCSHAASSYTICRLFVLVLSDIQSTLILTNDTSRPLVLLSFLSDKKYFYQYFHTHSIS